MTPYKSLLKIPFIAVCVFAGASTMTSCSKFSAEPNVEIIQDMMVSPAVKAQEYDESSPGGSGMRVPPDNTAPVGFQPYEYATNPEGAAKELKNPFTGDSSQEVVMTGQKYYETNCMICHGMHGEGSEKSSVAQFMALKPPPLVSDKVKGYSDGQLYHVITVGQGVMGPYAQNIPQAYRWQVVNYVRHLQKDSHK
ncbi:MAG: cytochrome c [Bdellovibrionota bacterium]